MRSTSFPLRILGLLASAAAASAQLTIDYTFTLNSTVPDNNQQGLADNRTLGGLSSFTVNSVGLSLSSPNGADPMFLGDLYSSLTYGLASEGPRVGVLLNRVGRDDGTTGGNVFGSSLSSFSASFQDGAGNNVWSAPANGTYRPDGRLISPNTTPIPFAEQGSPNNLGMVGGSAYTSNNYTLLVADVAGGGTAQLNGWNMNVTGTAAGSGAITAGTGGTYSITGTGTNTLGATVDTNGGTLAGGALSVSITGGTTTFNGAVSGANGLVKLGGGTLVLSNGSNSYAGGTTFAGGVTEFASGALGSTGNLAFTGGSLRYGSGNTQDVSGRVANSTSAMDFDTNGNNVSFGSALGSSNTGGLTKSGTGTLTLNGGTNSYTGATTVSGGTLQVNAGSTLSATSSVVLNGGGTLLLNASNQVVSSATASLNGGRLDLSNNGTNQTLGALTLSATSIISLGAAVTDTMTFADSSGATWNSAALLRIYNWSGTAANGTVYGANNDVLNFSSATGLNPGQVAQVMFYADEGTTFLGEGVILPDGSVVPIPEPMTWLGGALAVGLAGAAWRRRKSAA